MPGNTKNIGLFGGTFDPIHQGHLRVAVDVKQKFGFHSVVFIPAALPPHKPKQETADARDRMEMIRRSIAEKPGLSVSDVELQRKGPSYTVDTVQYFRTLFSPETRLFFIMGTDAFFEIGTWKSYETLFELIPFVVMVRPGSPGESGDDLLSLISTGILDGYRFSAERSCFVHDRKQPVYLQSVEPVDISSTRIRERIRKGISVEDLVPEPAAAYIKSQGLYQ